MAAKGKSLGYDAALSNDFLESEEDLVLRLGFIIHDAARLGLGVLCVGICVGLVPDE